MRTKIYTGILFFQMKFPEIFLSIISLISDESNNLRDSSFRESDSSIIGLCIQVSNNFFLQEGWLKKKILCQKRHFSSQENNNLCVDKISEFIHIFHKRSKIFTIFWIDSFKFTYDIEPKMIS